MTSANILSGRRVHGTTPRRTLATGRRVAASQPDTVTVTVAELDRLKQLAGEAETFGGFDARPIHDWSAGGRLELGSRTETPAVAASVGDGPAYPPEWLGGALDTGGFRLSHD